MFIHFCKNTLLTAIFREYRKKLQKPSPLGKVARVAVRLRWRMASRPGEAFSGADEVPGGKPFVRNSILPGQKHPPPKGSLPEGTEAPGKGSDGAFSAKVGRQPPLLSAKLTEGVPPPQTRSFVRIAELVEAKGNLWEGFLFPPHPLFLSKPMSHVTLTF